MARPKDYWDKIGRGNDAPVTNALPIKFTAAQILSVPRDRFASDEIYYCWLQYHSQQSLMELQPILKKYLEQAQQNGIQVGNALLALSGILSATGVGATVGSLLGIVGTLTTLVENSNKKADLKFITDKVNQIATEAQQLKIIYDDATAKLQSIRIEKVLTGGAIGLIAKKIFKKKRKNG